MHTVRQKDFPKFSKNHIWLAFSTVKPLLFQVCINSLTGSTEEWQTSGRLNWFIPTPLCILWCASRRDVGSTATLQVLSQRDVEISYWLHLNFPNFLPLVGNCGTPFHSTWSRFFIKHIKHSGKRIYCFLLWNSNNSQLEKRKVE